MADVARGRESLDHDRERGVGNGPVAEPEWGYVTSWDTWKDCETAFPIGVGFKLIDEATGREWLAQSPYEWEAART